MKSYNPAERLINSSMRMNGILLHIPDKAMKRVRVGVNVRVGERVGVNVIVGERVGVTVRVGERVGVRV